MNNYIDSKVKAYPIWSRDNSKLLLAFILTVIAVYIFPKLGIPQILIKLSFLFLLFIIFHSKDDVFWLSWFILIINGISRMFTIGTADNIYRIPMYRIMSGISLGFNELFLIMYIIKYLTKKTKVFSLFNKYAILILIYGAFTIAYSFILGISQSSLISSIRTILPWFWLIILPAFLSDTEKVEHSFQLIAPFVFICFILSIYSQITGRYLHDILSGESRIGYLGEAESELVRSLHSTFLIFPVVFLALFYMGIGKNKFNYIYLNLVIITGTLIIILSATRGWIIAFLILLSSYFFLKGYDLMKQLARVLIIVGIMIFIIQLFYPLFLFQLSKSYERFMSLEELVEGDLTAGGTLARITERGPRVMSEFRKSPIIGWGFSDYYFRHRDIHVGNQTMLLQGGVLGYLFWMIIYIMILYKIYSLGQYKYNILYIGKSYIIILLAMIASFVIHSSSTHMWGFYGSGQEVILQWAYILTTANAYLTTMKKKSIENNNYA